jgi:cytochrome c553
MIYAMSFPMHEADIKKLAAYYASRTYAMSFPMDEADIKKLAAYYASRTGK